MGASTVEALVAMWARVPSTPLATLVLALSARLPREEVPKKVSDRDERWIALAETRSPAVVPSLLAFEWPVHPREAKERIRLLVGFPPDPRVAHALRELWLAGRYRSSAGRPFWNVAFRLLVDWKDPQLAGVLAVKNGFLDERIVDAVLARLRGNPLPEEPAPTAEVIAALAEHGAGALPPDDDGTRASLLAAVYADPASDEPRLVLADFLLERGDPRGELIQLMNAIEHDRGTAKMKDRVRSLLRTGGKLWLDGIGPVVRDPTFRSGFAARVTLVGPLDPELPAWSTVESILCGYRAAGLAMALRHPNLRSVRALDGVRMEPLLELVTVDRALERLGIAPRRELVPVLTSRLRARHIALHIDASERSPRAVENMLAWFDASGFHAHARVLEISGASSIAPVRAYLTRSPQLESFRVWPYMAHVYTLDILGRTHLEVRLARAADGMPSVLELGWHTQSFDDRDDTSVREALTQLGGPLARVTLVTKLSRARAKALVETVEAATGIVPDLRRHA